MKGKISNWITGVRTSIIAEKDAEIENLKDKLAIKNFELELYQHKIEYYKRENTRRSKLDENN